MSEAAADTGAITLDVKRKFFLAVHERAQLTPTAKVVFDLLLFGFHNSKTGRCDPSKQTLSSRFQLGRTSVWRAINELRTKRIVTCEISGQRYSFSFPHILEPFQIGTGPVVHLGSKLEPDTVQNGTDDVSNWAPNRKENREKNSQKEPAMPVRFEDLLREWTADHPIKKTDPIKRARIYFDEQMPAGARGLAIRHARAYRNDLAKERRELIPHLVTYLSDELWLPYAAASASAAPPLKHHFITHGSDEWRAWERHENKKLRPVVEQGGAKGQFRLTRWPPNHSASSESEAEVSCGA